MKIKPIPTQAARVLTVFLLLALSLSACSVALPSSAISITVMAAASLTGAFQEAGAAYQSQHPGVKVTFDFAGSQALVQQIENAAPADVFASADQKSMDQVIRSGKVKGSAIFARNRLVVVIPAGAPALSLRDLARPGLKLVLADASVPVGNYSLQFLDKASQDAQFGAGYKSAVLKNVVSDENNVRAVLAKVTLGEADAGIVYATDAQSAPGKVQVIAIPDPLNVIAVYPIAVLQSSAHPAEAQSFVDFILSDAGQAILQKYGFQTK